MNRNEKVRKKIKAMMEVRNERKIKEKDSIRNDIKTLAMISEDFDPELYLKENDDKEEETN